MAKIDQHQQQDAADFNLKKKNRHWSLKKKLAYILAALVLVFICLVIFVNLATSAPVKVSNELVSDIQSGNSAAAFNLMSPAAQTATPQTEFDSVLSRISPILTGKPSMQSKEIKGETGSAATSTIVYKIRGTDGADYKFSIKLVKDNSEWKVQGFESTKY